MKEKIVLIVFVFFAVIFLLSLAIQYSNQGAAGWNNKKEDEIEETKQGGKK